MHPNSQRRTHGAEVKAAVLAECAQPGASIAAVALSHGLNANLVRKWLDGRGLKRCGLEAPPPAMPARVRSPAPAVATKPAPVALQFVPIDVVRTSSAELVCGAGDAAEARSSITPPQVADIHVELTRSGTQLSVRWPASEAGSCAAWLGGLTTAVLKA
jgi:transposase